MTQVTLRPAETDDLAFVTNCAESAYSLYIERIGKKPAPMVADFAAAQREGHLEIMQAEKVDIGFLVSFSRQDSLFVENVAIAPEHQGKGFGGAIFASRVGGMSGWCVEAVCALPRGVTTCHLLGAG